MAVAAARRFGTGDVRGCQTGIYGASAGASTSRLAMKPSMLA
jgi:hypothetical protein